MRQNVYIEIFILMACFCMLYYIFNDNRHKVFLATKNDIRGTKVLTPVPIIYGKTSNLSMNPEFDRNLAIVEVISDETKIGDYRTALGSVQCYAQMKGHYMYLLNMEHYMSICGHHADFFYRRHCVTANLLKYTTHDWYVFLDSDMEIINEFRSFEEFVDDKHDVYLYDRFWNWEIMAGSFIVRGNQFGYDFVKGFANYEFQHPKITHHGTDNGAVQAYVAEVVLHGRDKIADCWKLWESANGWDNIFDHQWCVRKKMGPDDDFEKVKIYKKGRGWARDGSLTIGKWNREIDFVFHDRKEKNKKPWDPKMKAYWYDTRMGPLDLKQCAEGTVIWYKRSELIANRTAIIDNLQNSASGIHAFLSGLYQRLNKSEVIEADFKDPINGKVVDRFATYSLKV